MERRAITAAGSAEEPISIRAHALGAGVDAAVPNPRRISDHDVESAAGHHGREVDVEGEEIELSLFQPLEHPAMVRDTLLQRTRARQVADAQISEQIRLRKRQLVKLPLIAVDRLRQQLDRKLLIRRSNQPGQRRPLSLRRISISGDQIGLRTQRTDPLAIDIAAAVAQEIGRAEE